MSTTFWIRKNGETIVGPLYTLDYHRAQVASEGATILELKSLAEFEPANYLRPGTVAHEQHERAKRAGSGANHAVRTLADGIYAYAIDIGPDGDHVAGPEVRALLEAFVALLSAADHGGWDAGTCDTWARYVADFITEPME